MKTNPIIFVLLFASTTSVLAILTVSFPGWDLLKDKSPDIIIARCTKTPLQSYGDGEFYSDVDVVSVLKGTNGLRSSQLWSLREARQGEYYLVYSTFHDGSYQAIEEYRVIPLGGNFSTNSIAGKALDEQLQILFKRRIDNLNQEILHDGAEIQRLEEGMR
jgi:hypothetical protein